MKISRKTALKNIAGLSALGLLGLPEISKAADNKRTGQRVNHSVCRWPYANQSLEVICEAAVEMGISSVELLNPDEWPIVQKYGLTCAMSNCVPMSLTDGFNDPGNHEQLRKDYFDLIPKAADAGLKNIICFSGNRRGMTDQVGMENCARGLEPVVKKAAEHGLTICMELLNSKVNHPDYQCDHTGWGVALCEKVGSESFKLLYDIYHMQIMEGDIIATIQKYHPYIAHYHTGGVPGRNEIDETQELNYRAIMEAIVATGFTGYVAQEFIPKNEDVFHSLAHAVRICDV